MDGPKTVAVVPPTAQPTEVSVPVGEAQVAKEEVEQPPASNDITLEHPKAPDFDISDVIAIRLRAMRQLSENPQSDDAKTNLENATQMVNNFRVSVDVMI